VADEDVEIHRFTLQAAPQLRLYEDRQVRERALIENRRFQKALPETTKAPRHIK
jgi:hypothetical protein